MPYSFSQGYDACNSFSNALKGFKLIIPGHGQSSRTEGLMRNIKRMRASIPRFLIFSCHIFVYNPSISIKQSICSTTHSSGLTLWSWKKAAPTTSPS